jgi:hypothetical protein
MGRGSQRKRRSAAARRTAARRVEAAAELEQVQARAVALAQARLDRLYDPSTPAGEIAELVRVDRAPHEAPGLPHRR